MGKYPVAVDHDQVRTIASERVYPSDFQPYNRAALHESLLHSTSDSSQMREN